MQVIDQVKQTKWYWVVLLINAMLFLVWPLAHTIALRKLLLLIAAIAGSLMIWQSPHRKILLQQTWLKWMVALLVWVIFHAAFLSQNGVEAWHEFRGQWLPPFLAIFAGIGVALAGWQVETKLYMRLLLVCALALPTFYLMENLVKWWQVGYLPMGYMKPGEPNFVLAGTDLKTSLTFSLEMLVPFSCFKLLELWKSERRMVFRTFWLIPIVLAAILAYVSQIKNFMILFVLSIVLTLLVHGFRTRFLNVGRLLLGAAGLIIFIVLLTTNVNSLNQKMASVLNDMKIAWDIDKYQNWKNDEIYGLPKNEQGEELNESFYLRLAFAHAAWRDMWENLQGYGVTRKAMERLEQKKDASVSIANAQNGYLNLACAVGLPGLGLFVAAMAAVFLQLKQSRSGWAVPASWMIGFYLLHWAVDAVERDHFFEMFMYVTSLMLTHALLDNGSHEHT